MPGRSPLSEQNENVPGNPQEQKADASRKQPSPAPSAAKEIAALKEALAQMTRERDRARDYAGITGQKYADNANENVELKAQLQTKEEEIQKTLTQRDTARRYAGEYGQKYANSVNNQPEVIEQAVEKATAELRAQMAQLQAQIREQSASPTPTIPSSNQSRADSPAPTDSQGLKGYERILAQQEAGKAKTKAPTPGAMDNSNKGMGR